MGQDCESPDHSYDQISLCWKSSQLQIDRFRSLTKGDPANLIVGPREESVVLKNCKSLYDRVSKACKAMASKASSDDEKRSGPLAELEKKAKKASSVGEMCEAAMEHIKMRHGPSRS